MHLNLKRRLPLLAAAALFASFALPLGDSKTPAFTAGFETITEGEVRAHVNYLASPALEGRDTPSSGLTAALQFAARELQSYGYKGLGDEDGYLLPWTYPRELETPDVEKCSFETEGTGSIGAATLTLGRDFTPLPGANGEAEGQVVFLGFGIHAPKERYDDLRGGKLKGKLAMILTEEPRHKKLLEGPEISEAANVYDKLAELEDEGIKGVLIVRRPSADNAVDPKKTEVEGEPPLDFGFHHTWATWNDTRNDQDKRAALPAIEITVEVANRMLGEDVLELAASMDKKGKTKRRDLEDTVVRFSSQTEKRRIEAANVAGILEGSDPELSEEIVVLGAHFDHLGMDSRGRLAAGADDNASGSSALLEIAEAMALAQPKRSILIVGFSGEEDGLLGSAAFCENPPVRKERMVTMINLDMVWRGKASSTVVLGVTQNPDLGKVLKRASKLAKTGIKKVTTNEGDELWQRSDHYSFHKLGVPVLFFFEAVPITDNHDYHTWRDTPEGVDCKKVTQTARLVYNTAWLVAQDEKRPREPRR